MCLSTLILGQGGGDFGELAYIIAFLLLGGVGALAEWIKKKQEASKQERDLSKPHKASPEPQVFDLDRLRDLLTQQGRPHQPQTPTGRRPPVVQAQPRAPQPLPARRPKVARPPVVEEETRPRSKPLGQEVVSRKVGRVVVRDDDAQVVRRTLNHSGVEQAITKMASNSVITPVSTSMQRAAIVRAPATKIGTLSAMSVAELRRAFVMSEILQPPIALRE